MQIIHKTVGLFTIPSDTRIIRVFSGKKAEWLFQDEAIWFSNIHYLQEQCDHLERTIPASFFQGMTLPQADFYKRCNAAKDDVFASFISCWSKLECEDLWHTYDETSDGFAIVTTVGKLMNAFDQQYIFPCEVKYVNLNECASRLSLPWIYVEDPDTNLFHSLRLKEMYKATDWDKDNEIRFICFDWAKEENKRGIYIKVNFHDIIDFAIINPFANESNASRMQTQLINRGISLMHSSIQQCTTQW